MTDKITDKQIIAKVVGGDIDSYSAVVEKYEAPLTRYVGSIVFNKDSADDIVQETFIKTYINLRSYNPEKRFSSWIYRIAHNEAINYIRKNKKELTTDKEDWFDRVVDSKDSIDKLLDEKFDSDKVRTALSSLKPKYRQPIVLHFIEGKSYQEISEILRIPSATVGTRINRAKKQLRTIIEERK